MTRSDYVVALEIVTLSPLTHGAGTRGNESVWRTTEYLIDVPDPELPGRMTSRRIRVPVVSGAAFKATLRQHAVSHLAEALGLADGSLSRDVLRLLLKGGKNDSSGQSVSLDEHRRLRALFPLLAVFGSMDGGMPVKAQLDVAPIRPYCQELVDAGLIHTKIGGLSVSIDGQELMSSPQIEVFADKAPQRLADLQTTEQYYRHDMGTSPLRPLVGAADATALADLQAERALLTAPNKEVRRAVNESMPHAHQAIIPGARLIAEIRLHGATEIERDCLFHAIVRWIQKGATLGGATTKGHGRCQVRIPEGGAIAYTPSPLTGEAAPSTAITVDGGGKAYLRHIQDNAEALREHMCGA